MRNAFATLCLAAALAAGLSMAAAPAEAQFTIGKNFIGSSVFTESFSIPPDTDGAVGPNHFVELINGRFRVYNKATGAAVQSLGLDQFWASTNPALPGGVQIESPFDPRVIYDHHSQRWFATSADNRRSANSNILLAVSATSDPTGPWKGFSIKADNIGDVWNDFPTLGLDRDGVYISTNMYANADDAFNSVTLFSIPKADLTAAVPTLANMTSFMRENASNRGFAIQPAIDYGPSDGRAALLAADADASTAFNRTSVLGATAAAATLSASVNIAITPVSTPPAAFQPDGSQVLDTGDERLGASVYEVGNSLWAVQGIDVGGRAGFRWYEIDEVTNALKQSGTFSSAAYDYFFPSIAANPFGEVVIGFTRSGANATNGFASSFAVGGTTFGGVTTFGAPTLLFAGSANYHLGSPVRWGDYSATSLDPNDPHTFWTIQEYASAQDTWSTRITELKFTAVAVPEPSVLMLGGTALSGFLLASRRRRRMRH